MSSKARDPREIITPDAFSVAPDLLGTPLARPWRRGVAMGLDLLLIAVIAGLRISWFLLFLAVTILFFRAAIRPSVGALRKGTRRAVFGALAAMALVGTLIAGYEVFAGFSPLAWLASTGDAPVEGEAVEEPGVMDALGTARDVLAVQTASSETELTAAATRLGVRLQSLGVERGEIRTTLDALAEGREEPWAQDAMAAALANLGLEAETVREPVAPDSLVFAYAAALQAGDSAAMGALHEPLVDAIGADRIAALEERNEQLVASNEDLEQRLEQERDRGLISLIRSILDEVGIEFGWSALYFTFFPVIWRGRTPGKRLLRMRIVRLDGRPLGWWSALNRFGGYAASIFTGLLGFFEMFWDDNRQAMQDRIAATVVVLETAAAADRPAETAKPEQ
ncbi:MAG: RDD family protein [Gemmatimonadota bacterium]|nr:MAG: RDD family protein [Gemmatimonadota bacterium]